MYIDKYSFKTLSADSSLNFWFTNCKNSRIQRRKIGKNWLVSFSGHQILTFTSAEMVPCSLILFATMRTGVPIKRVRICYLLKENILLGKAIPCSWWCIPHPLRSLAWSQPLLRPLHFPHPPAPTSLTPCTHFPPTEHLVYIKMTLTSPILLLGTNLPPTPFRHSDSTTHTFRHCNNLTQKHL